MWTEKPLHLFPTPHPFRNHLDMHNQKRWIFCVTPPLANVDRRQKIHYLQLACCFLKGKGRNSQRVKLLSYKLILCLGGVVFHICGMGCCKMYHCF